MADYGFTNEKEFLTPTHKYEKQAIFNQKSLLEIDFT
jgi:hypothetical protein